MVRRRSPASPSRPRTLFLVAVLLLTLGLVAALAFEAYRAGRSHRRVTEQVLQDYVRFAARELAGHSSRALTLRAGELLSALGCGPEQDSAAEALARIGDGDADPGCGCGGAVPEVYVRFDPATAAIIDAAGDLDGTTRVEIQQLLAAAPRNRPAGLVGISREGRPALLAWRNFAGEAPVPVHAVVFEKEMLAAIVDGVVDARPLLPAALVDPGAQRDYLTAELRLAEGAPLYRTGAGPASRFSAQEPLEAGEEQGVQVVASLAPGAADELVIGGLPRSRLPLLSGLLLVVVGLVAVAVHQLRREHELARLRDAFVSGVSHELRTPLAQIRLFTETLRLGRVRSDEETERSLDILDEEAERLSHLVDNLLDFNRAGRVATSVTLEELPLAAFVEETVERFAPLVRTHDDRFVMDVPDDLVVRADRAALARVLTNLLDNAVKYGSHGQTVRIAATEAEGRVHLIVDDEGSGVQRSDRGRIWEPFVRGSHRDDAATGTGIGLSVVRDLTAAMGGRARVGDAPRGGARFVIELDMAAGPDAAGLEPSRAPA